MTDLQSKVNQSNGDEFPAGFPADPSVSYNPSRMLFELSDEDLPDTQVVESPSPQSQNPESPSSDSFPGSAVNPTEEVKHGFELRRMIGRGGFGEVWEGVQHSLHRVIAVKRVREDIYEKARMHSQSSSFCEMGFRHEALTTGALDHPNIVPVYDFGQDKNGRPILAMKLVRGKPWDHIMWDDYNNPSQEFLDKHLQIFISVAQAAAFAHSRGVVHRDIKPAQVMVGEFGEVVLMDWGLALVYDRELTSKHETSLSSGVVPTCDSAPNPAGTIAFMAPEQTENSSINIGPHTDVYLLAGTLYFLLTRTPPHAAPDSKAAYIEAKAGMVDHPRDRAKDREIPEELATLCMRAMEPDIDKRLKTATELIDGVKAYLTGAGKRRDSELLVREAREIIEAKNCRYRDLARGQSAIERAAGLWPDNPDIDEVREALHIRYSRLALNNRDLVLASAQVERIGSTETRREIRKAIGKRQKYLLWIRWSARIFTTGTILLLVVVSFMARDLNQRATEAQRLREAAEAGERAALENRRNAEDLVNFLVEDLYKSLERMGRLDLIDRVAVEANQYYMNLPATGSTDQRSESLRRALALRLLGDVQTQDRTRVLADSLVLYRQSLEICEELAERYPDRLDVMSSLASSRFRVGNILVWSGDPETGLRDLQASEKLNREVYTRDPTQTYSLLEATLSVLLRAEVLGYMGQPEFAESLMRDAAALLRTLEGLESTRPEARGLRARTAIKAADEAARLGLMEDALEHLLVARRDLELLVSDNSYDLHRRVGLARVESIGARVEMHRGSLEVAREKNLAAIEEMEKVLEFSLRNTEWQRHLAEAYIVQAYIEIGLAGNLEAGIEWVSRAVVISRGTAFQDQSNVISQTWLAVTHGIVGTLMQEYDRSNLALGELDTAMTILEALIEQAPTMTFWTEERWRYIIVWARALADTGGTNEAATRMADLEAEMLESARAEGHTIQLLLANARLLRGQCLLQRDREEEAKDALHEAEAGARRLVQEKAPNRYLAMRAQAAALILLDRMDEAAPIIRTLSERGFVGRELGTLILENSEIEEPTSE